MIKLVEQKGECKMAKTQTGRGFAPNSGGVETLS